MASAGCLRYRALAVALLTWSVGAAAAQSQELRGRVVTGDGTPIAGATVTLTAIRYDVRTDSLGRFVLTGTPGGTLELSIAADGFRAEAVSVVLPRGRAVNRDFILVVEDSERAEEESVGLLRGIVRGMDDEPLAYANVQLNGGRRVVATDSGRFSIPVTTDGAFALVARRIGYEAAELKLARLVDTAVTITMKPLAVQLAAQRITARSAFVNLDLRGFYRRLADAEKGVNTGYFVTPEEIELRKPQQVTDAVRHLPNIRIRPGNAEVTRTFVAGVGEVVRAVPNARNMRIEDASGCTLTVYLDGIRISPTLRAIGSNPVSDLQDEQINTILGPGAVAGIEVYPRGLSAPAEYQPLGGTCGIVLFWTR